MHFMWFVWIIFEIKFISFSFISLDAKHQQNFVLFLKGETVSVFTFFSFSLKTRPTSETKIKYKRLHGLNVTFNTCFCKYTRFISYLLIWYNNLYSSSELSCYLVAEISHTRREKLKEQLIRRFALINNITLKFR